MIWKLLTRSFWFLILLLLSYFLLSKALISWVQYSPAKSTEIISKITGVSTSYQRLYVRHTWLGFELQATSLQVISPAAQLAAEDLQLDLNLFSLLSPSLPVGDNLQASKIELKTFDTGATRPGSGELIAEKIYKFLSKTWRQISISHLVFIPHQDQNYHLLISNFNSQKLDGWQVLAKIKLFKYSQNLANFQFKADFELDTLQRLRTGKFAVEQIGGSSLESLALIAPMVKDLVANFETGNYEMTAYGEVADYKLADARAQLKLENLKFNRKGNLLNVPNLEVTMERTAQNQAQLKLDFPKPIEFITEFSEQQNYQVQVNQAWLVDFKAADASWAFAEPAEFLLNGVPTSLQGSGDFDGAVDLALQAQISDVHFLKHHFLPYPMMRPSLVDWLKNSLVAGHSIEASAILQGKLQDFPFTDRPGEFYAKAVMQESELKFNPEWPSIRDFAALVEFRPFDLTISSARGKIFAADAHDIVVDINNLHTKDVAVEVQAHAFSESQKAFDFLLASPLAQHLGLEAFLQEFVTAEGNLRVDLDKLFIPVSGFEGREIEVLGKVELADQIKLVDAVDLNQLQGELQFSENALWTESPISAEFYGGKHQISVKTDFEAKNIVINSVGSVVLNDYGLQGEVPANSKTVVPFGGGLLNEVKFDLVLQPQNLQTQWPAPFDHASLQNPLHLTWELEEGKELYKLQLAQEFELEVRKLQSKIDKAKEGFQVNGVIQKLDLDAWISQAPQISELIDLGEASDSSLYWLASKLQIQQPSLWQQSYAPLNLSWQTMGEQLQLTAKSTEMDLKISQINKPSRKLVVNADLLQIKLAEESIVSPVVINKGKHSPAKLETCETTMNQAWSEVEFKGRNLLIGKRMLNELSFEVINTNKGWQVKDAKLQALNGMATGDLNYQFITEADSSQLKIELQSQDVASFTEFLGVRKGFTGKQAKLDLDLYWPGDLGCFAKDNLQGSYQGKFRDGVIEELEPGLARIIGLLSVDSIVRRLKLDIKDVTNKGMEYSKLDLKGNFDANFYYLDELKVRSPGVRLDLNGRIASQDLKLYLNAQVTPAVGSSLPVLAGIIGFANPVTGLATYLIAKNLPFINEDIISYSYQVSGDVEEPELKLKSASLLIK